MFLGSVCPVQTVNDVMMALLALAVEKYLQKGQGAVYLLTCQKKKNLNLPGICQKSPRRIQRTPFP